MLDRVISHLIRNPTSDDLLIHRLQKRKLAVKEQSLLLEALLVHVIPA
ncbi:MAG: YdcH family protein [Azonexus sp.]|nr:YdcH family protein [Azonexus sp.]